MRAAPAAPPPTFPLLPGLPRGGAPPMLRWRDCSSDTEVDLAVRTSPWRAPDFLLQAAWPLTRSNQTMPIRTRRSPGAPDILCWAPPPVGDLSAREVLALLPSDLPAPGTPALLAAPALRRSVTG